MRRMIDILVSSTVLFLTLPIMVLIAILIKLDSRGPIFYVTERVGQHGKRFRQIDFRTWTHEPVLADRVKTRFGRLLITTSLNHWPQFINVLRGDMSIVGPRPTEPERVILDDPDWQVILSVKPGMFCWAVLNLATDFNASSQQTKNQLERQYIEQRSTRFDLHVLREWVRELIKTRGNIKARGEPRVKPHTD